MKYLTQFIDPDFNKIQEHDYRFDHFTVTALEDNCTCTISNPSGVYYSYDLISWSQYVNSAFVIPIYKKCYFKASDVSLSHFTFSKKVELSGNLESLMLDGDTNYTYHSNIMGNGKKFESLFINNSNIIYAHNLCLPYCHSDDAYNQTFKNCANMKTIPHIEIDFSTIPYQYFYQTFANCTSLISIKSISNSIKYINRCSQSTFEKMFEGCTNLIYAFNSLRIDQLNNGDDCAKMFNGCESLKRAPNLYFTYIANTNNSATFDMFRYCKALKEVNIYDNQVHVEEYSLNNSTKAYRNIYCDFNDYDENNPLTNITIRDGFTLNFGHNAYTDDIDWPDVIFENSTDIEANVDYKIKNNLYYNDYFTIENIDNSNIEFTINTSGFISALNNNIYKVKYEMAFSKDNGKTWTYIQHNSSKTVTVRQSEKIYIKGNLKILKHVTNNISPSLNSGAQTIFSINGGEPHINVSGNILSLIYWDDFKNKYNLFVPIGIFNKLLSYAETNLVVVNSKNLVIPFIDSNASISKLLQYQNNQYTQSLPFLIMPLSTSLEVYDCEDAYYHKYSVLYSSYLGNYDLSTLDNMNFNKYYINSSYKYRFDNENTIASNKISILLDGHIAVTPDDNTMLVIGKEYIEPG